MKNVSPASTHDARALPAPEPVRLASLDAMRGLAILAIIGFDGAVGAFGDMSKSGPGWFRDVCALLARQFSHVEWAGLHLYDMVFPLFLFITGASVAFVIPHALERQGRSALYGRILRRTALLYLLGVIYYGGVSGPWEEIRYVGVLQRIAACYLATSLLVLHLPPAALAWAAAAILLLYWALLGLVGAPGVPAGSLTPDANLVDWFDRAYLPGRLWYGQSDPEGLLSTIPAVATCLIGALAGALLRARPAPRRALLALVGGGALMAATGAVWGLWFPVIKALWTSSFVLVTGGASAMLLGAAYWALDVRRVASATWLVWVGANAITLYMLSGFGLFDIAAARLVGGDLGALLDRLTAPGASALLIHLAGLALAIALAGFLHRKRVFIRLLKPSSLVKQVCAVARFAASWRKTGGKTAETEDQIWF